MHVTIVEKTAWNFHNGQGQADPKSAYYYRVRSFSPQYNYGSIAPLTGVRNGLTAPQKM